MTYPYSDCCPNLAKFASLDHGPCDDGWCCTHETTHGETNVTAADLIHTFWYGKANMCGCGDPEVVLAMIRDELARLSLKGDRPEPERAPAWYLLAYSLDAWGLSEHGTSLGWPWLTDEGEALLAAMQSVDLASALDDGSMIVQEAP